MNRTMSIHRLLVSLKRLSNEIAILPETNLLFMLRTEDFILLQHRAGDC
ncbi:hypothetical protein [Paenibacillus sp. OSY-SE]|nr:hypothetical protein [Paenibacillus sp. OSY-SE]